MHHFDALVVIKRIPAMLSSMQGYKRNIQSGFLVLSQQFDRLIYGHLRILIAMNHQQGRVVYVDMKHGTRFLGDGRNILWTTANKELKGGDANAQTVRC